jgi:hypothetical protein
VITDGQTPGVRPSSDQPRKSLSRLVCGCGICRGWLQRE